MNDRIKNHPALAAYLDRADHVDVKTAQGPVDLRQFIAAMFGRKPAWVTFLFRLRGLLAALLGLEQPEVIADSVMRPEDVSFEPGRPAAFFTVTGGRENDWWLAGAGDKHLNAWIAVAIEPLGGPVNRFHVATIVHYKHWTGPVYFNLIRPFHHLVVSRMVRAGARGQADGDQ